MYTYENNCYFIGGVNNDAIKIGNYTLTDAFIYQLLSSSINPPITKPTIRIAESCATLIGGGGGG